MTLFAVEGVAGSGKTFRVMEILTQTLGETPLAEGQRVLALTFMHGARRRLNQKLLGVTGLFGRFECMTIDSFAWRLMRRWRGLATAIGLPSIREDQYDQQCDAAGALLERSEVRNWIAASFPVVLIDEAQDLKPQRLRIVCALAGSLTTLIAADEFQCLDVNLRPNPLVLWLHQKCKPEVLNRVRRTNVGALLTAAAAIRDGAAPCCGPGFNIIPAKSAPMAAAFLANAIGWRPSDSVAIITPSLTGNFSQQVVERVCKQACGKNGNGPYPIRWERSDDEAIKTLIEDLAITGEVPVTEAVAAVDRLPRSGVVRETLAWVQRQARVTGRATFSFAQIVGVIAEKGTAQRRWQAGGTYKLVAMTVQQAKNREFDGVVVLWPFAVGGDPEQKRRLLYNDMTRA